MHYDTAAKFFKITSFTGLWTPEIPWRVFVDTVAHKCLSLTETSAYICSKLRSLHATDGITFSYA